MLFLLLLGLSGLRTISIQGQMFFAEVFPMGQRLLGAAQRVVRTLPVFPVQVAEDLERQDVGWVSEIDEEYLSVFESDSGNVILSEDELETNNFARDNNGEENNKEEEEEEEERSELPYEPHCIYCNGNHENYEDDETDEDDEDDGDNEDDHNDKVDENDESKVKDAEETPEDEANEEEEVEYNLLTPFAAVLDSINRDHIPDYALSVRQRLDPHYEGGPPKVWDPVCGSFNVCFPLDFDDGVAWIIRFPISGTKEDWQAMSRRALTAEAKTMMFLKKETTIPLPEVLDFCATLDNELNSPYMLMSYIDGLPLYKVWWGHLNGRHTPEENEKARHRVLEGVASAMKQLGQFTFSKGGSLEFGEDGKPTGVGPVRRVDHLAEFRRYLDEDGGSTAQPIYYEAGPFLDPEDQYTVDADRRVEQTGERDAGVEILKILLHKVPEMDEDDDQFDLAHPDFDTQNILVSADGELRGIIDWDGVAAVPTSVGSRAYPMWLTRDWDSLNYRGRELSESANDQGARVMEEDSPATLKRYRDVYRRFLDEAHPELKMPVSQEMASECTRISHVTRTLYLAGTEATATRQLLQHVMIRAEAAAPEGVELDFVRIFMDMMDDTITDAKLDEIEDAFELLMNGE